MAGREQISARKIHNMGLGKLQKACDGIVDSYMAKEHPLALLKIDEEAMDALMEMSADEFKLYLKNLLKLNLSKSLHRLAKEIENVPTRHLPATAKMLHDSLKDIEGDANQRVEGTKKGMGPEEFIEALKGLKSDKALEDDKWP